MGDSRYKRSVCLLAELVEDIWKAASQWERDNRYRAGLEEAVREEYEDILTAEGTRFANFEAETLRSLIETLFDAGEYME